MEQPVSRRALFATLVGGAGLAATACQSSPSTVELDTPEGKVLQWQGEDLLVLVSGYQPRYQLGQQIHVNVMVNNQSTQLAEVKVRTKLLGLGDQAVVEAEVATLSIRSDDAASVDRDLPLTSNVVTPGEYTLSVELPPWQFNGRETGTGATLRTTVRVDPNG